MCRAVRCGKCGKTTWAGCGAHVAQVMGPVPKDQRCVCAETKSAVDADPSEPGFFARLFGKR